jgi:hypothetical protein
MAKAIGGNSHKRVHKNTCQNGSKTSTANKSRKRIKAYRGQGR